MRIILGSRSPWRKKLLEGMGYAVEVLPADVDEKQFRAASPDALTLLLAREKAKALVPTITSEALLITSDTVVVWHGQVREKPATAEEVRVCLHEYATAPVEAVASVVITNTKTGDRKEGVEHATVHFRPIPPEAVDALIADGCVFGCAGGFCIQHPLFAPWIERVDGEVECVAGLPRALTRRLLGEMTEPARHI